MWPAKVSKKDVDGCQETFPCRHQQLLYAIAKLNRMPLPLFILIHIGMKIFNSYNASEHLFSLAP